MAVWATTNNRTGLKSMALLPLNQICPVRDASPPRRGGVFVASSRLLPDNGEAVTANGQEYDQGLRYQCHRELP